MTDQPELPEWPLISRGEAKAIGQKWYFTGKPCPQGHVYKRTVASGTCSRCVLDKRSKYTYPPTEENREKARVAARAHRAKVLATDPERLKTNIAAWRAANQDHVRSYSSAYSKRRPEVKRMAEARRRARKREAGGSFTMADVLDLFRRQRGRCAGCRASIKPGYEIDHIQPLVKGGHNAISNIQLLCRPCNRQKQAQDPIDWAQKTGRLL